MMIAVVGLQFVFLGVGVHFGYFDAIFGTNLAEFLPFLKANWIILFLGGTFILVYAAIQPSHRSIRWPDYPPPTSTLKTDELIHEAKPSLDAVEAREDPTELVPMKCPRCSGNLHFPAGSTVTDCKYCGTQVKLYENLEETS
jgi:hypothetical protein